MTAKSTAEIKAEIDAHIDAFGVPSNPPSALRAVLFDIIDSAKPYNAPDPHTIRLTYPGVAPPNSMLLGEVFVVGVDFPANLEGSQFRCVVAPNEAFEIDIRKNGAVAGRILFDAHHTIASLSTTDGEPLRFEVGDVLQLFSQSDLDVISGIFGALAGTRF